MSMQCAPDGTLCKKAVGGAARPAKHAAEAACAHAAIESVWKSVANGPGGVRPCRLRGRPCRAISIRDVRQPRLASALEERAGDARGRRVPRRIACRTCAPVRHGGASKRRGVQVGRARCRRMAARRLDCTSQPRGGPCTANLHVCSQARTVYKSNIPSTCGPTHSEAALALAAASAQLGGEFDGVVELGPRPLETTCRATRRVERRLHCSRR